MLSMGPGCHAAFSESPQETDAEVGAVQPLEAAESPSATQLQSEEDQQFPSSEADTIAMSVPSIVPVLGESFCQCEDQEQILLGGFSPDRECLCGEDDDDFHWVWDEGCKSSGAFLSCEDRKVSFHSDYSCGTAAIRGTKELGDGQHFWEIKMTSPVYGTDMMVGIGTSEVNLEKFKYSFGSLLGHDEDSWGLSYTGLLQHRGDKVKFSSRFGQGSIIGVHLDTWHGTLTFYKNRHRIGVAATRLQNKKLFPMVCSTAAKSSMKVIRACHARTSLQYLCCARLRQMMPDRPGLLDALGLPPGLRSLLHSQLDWVFTLSEVAEEADAKEEEEEEAAEGEEEESIEEPGLFAFPHLLSPQAPPPAGDEDGSSSEPEDCQCKRGRWT